MAKKKAEEASTSKVDYVREALTAIGKDATAAQVGEHIKTKHGDEVAKGITGSMLSNYTTLQKQKIFGGGVAKKRGRKPGSKVAAVSAPAAAAPAPAKKGGLGTDLNSLEAMVGKYGADGVMQLVELIGK